MYEEKKIIMLQFLQSICSPEGVFPADLMARMKDYCEGDEHLKASTKVCIVYLVFFYIIVFDIFIFYVL